MTQRNIQLDIWQFVRIMVEAENNANGRLLLNTYQDIWQDVDETLSETAQNDVEKYAQMMMETQITLTGVNRPIADCIMEMSSEVISQLTKGLAKIKEENVQQDYAFEIHGLEQLVDEISE